MPIRCVGLGEVLWDDLPLGRQLGGAPANFAYHASVLGADATVVSRVGLDRDGHLLSERLNELGIATHALERDDRAPTSTVGVEQGPDGQPRYVIHEDVAWDYLAGEAAGQEEVARADAICFGTLAQRHAVARATIHSLLSVAPSSALRIFDINLRQHFFSREVILASLGLANVVKVNETELPELIRLLELPREARSAVAALAARFSLRAVIYTRGREGCLVFADGAWVDHPGKAVAVVDTVGAGDSFTAAFAVGLLRGWALEDIVTRAIAISAYVCTQRGATPSLPAECRAPFAAAG